MGREIYAAQIVAGGCQMAVNGPAGPCQVTSGIPQTPGIQVERLAFPDTYPYRSREERHFTGPGPVATGPVGNSSIPAPGCPRSAAGREARGA